MKLRTILNWSKLLHLHRRSVGAAQGWRLRIALRPKKKAPIRPKPNECQDEGLESSSEDELFWVAGRDYADATIRDWTQTPNRRRVHFLLVNRGLRVSYPPRRAAMGRGHPREARGRGDRSEGRVGGKSEVGTV